MKLRVVLSLLVALLAPAAAVAAGGPWNFRVLLDGKPIGSHRFTFDGTQARIDAAFDVKFLGFNAYRYRHEATETWRGDCLAGLDARTDDDGKTTRVRAMQKDGKLVIDGPKGEQPVDGCLMTFAYWNPAILKQGRLLNPQTGVIETVEARLVDEQPIEVRGARVPARHYRLTGPEQPIDLWYSPQGEWLALESTVAGGRKLGYRLE